MNNNNKWVCFKCIETKKNIVNFADRMVKYHDGANQGCVYLPICVECLHLVCGDKDGNK